MPCPASPVPPEKRWVGSDLPSAWGASREPCRTKRSLLVASYARKVPLWLTASPRDKRRRTLGVAAEGLQNIGRRERAKRREGKHRAALVSAFEQEKSEFSITRKKEEHISELEDAVYGRT